MIHYLGSHPLISCLLIYIIFYFYFLIRDFLNLKTVTKLSIELNNYLTAIDSFWSQLCEENRYIFGEEKIHNFYDYLRKKDKEGEYHSLLSLNPKINAIDSYLTINHGLSFSNDPFKNLENADYINKKLLDKRQNYKFALSRNRNPLYTLSRIFNLPAALLSHIGIHSQSSYMSNIINAVIWVTGAIFNFFSDEIKDFLFNLIK